MNDMAAVIIPKSDQLNSDDLIAGPRTITITRVEIRPGTEQPVSIFYEGDDGKPWKSCKSMNRVLVAAWGPDAKAYVGRSVTLVRDPTVKWGGMDVGGIRISHLSHIERDMVMALTATRGKRAPYTVRVLQAPAERDRAAEWAADYCAKVSAATTWDALKSAGSAGAKRLGELQTKRPELYAKCIAAFDGRSAELGPDTTDVDPVTAEPTTQPPPDGDGFGD